VVRSCIQLGEALLATDAVGRLDEMQPVWVRGVGGKASRPGRTLASEGQVGSFLAPMVVLAEGVRDGQAPFHECLPDDSQGGNASLRQQARPG